MPAVSTVAPPESPPIESAKPGAERIHDLEHDSSVLALAANDEYIYAGTQDGEIVVWSLGTFQRVARVQAHRRSVLCLFLSKVTATTAAAAASTDSQLLVSSAGDAIISIWCPKTLKRLYEIYSLHDVGDIFSVAYSPQHETVYFGAQNTSIQWVNLKDPKRKTTHDSAQHPDRRSHRFFDSAPAGGTSTPRRNEERWTHIPRAETVLEADHGAILQFAHYGYVYCMLMAKGLTHKVDAEEDVLISGAGDGTVKLWRLGAQGDGDDDDGSPSGIQELIALGTDDGESVWSIAIDRSFLYCGKLGGVIELWDLDTAQRLRVIKSHEKDVMTLQMRWGSLWSAAANGFVSVGSPYPPWFCSARPAGSSLSL